MCLLHLQHSQHSHSTTKHPVGWELLALDKLTSLQPHGFLLYPLHKRTQDHTTYTHARYHAPSLIQFNPFQYSITDGPQPSVWWWLVLPPIPTHWNRSTLISHLHRAYLPRKPFHMIRIEWNYVNRVIPTRDISTGLHIDQNSLT